jgi:tetratricopeptide (TPR) repeat protein
MAADLQLDTLEARGLIRVAALHPELEYLFRHALLQDTAYESLLKQERRVLHEVVGSAIEELYPERVGELAAVLGMHFEQAGAADKAVRYLAAAGKFASDRNAIVEAYDLYSRAAALLPERSEDEPDDIRRMRIEIQLGRARAGFTFMPESAGLDMILPLVDDARSLGDLRLEAELHLSSSLLQRFRGVSPEKSAQLRYSLQRISEIAEELDDPFIAALPESIVGLFRVFTGDLRGGIELLEKTGPQLEQKNDFVGSSFALMALGLGYGRMGEFEKADDALARAREIAQGGDIIAQLDALIGTAWVASIKGDLDGAVPLAQQCTGMAEQAGASSCIVASNFVLSDALIRQGKFGDAKLALDRSTDVANAIEQRQFRPSLSALAHLNAAQVGDVASHALSFDDAFTEADSFGDSWAEALIFWDRAQVEARKKADARDSEQMLADFDRAAQRFEDMGARPFHARVLRDWGQALQAVRRDDEGNDKLRRAISLFDELGIEREATEARASLGVAGRA